MEKQTIKGVPHYVYDTYEEFKENCPSEELHDDWRTGNEGDWVKSDDGRIIQLLKVSKNVNHPGDRKNYK